MGNVSAWAIILIALLVSAASAAAEVLKVNPVRAVKLISRTSHNNALEISHEVMNRRKTKID